MSLFIVFFVDVYAVMSIIIMFLCGRFHRIVGSTPTPSRAGRGPDVCATYIWVGPGPAVGGVCALNAFTGVYFTYASAHRCGFIISNYSVPFKIIWAWPALRGIIEGACAGRARTDYGFYGEFTHGRRVSVLPESFFGSGACDVRRPLYALF